MVSLSAYTSRLTRLNPETMPSCTASTKTTSARERHSRQKETAIAKPIPEGLDVVMTRGPPHRQQDKCRTGKASCDMLMHALEQMKPQMSSCIRQDLPTDKMPSCYNLTLRLSIMPRCGPVAAHAISPVAAARAKQAH